MDKKIRHNYLVDKRFQGSMILKMCAVVVGMTVIITLLTLWFNGGSTTVAVEHARVVAKKTSEFLLPVMLQIAFIVILVSAIALGTAVLMITHRIAGPAYRLKKEVNEMIHGVYSVSFKVRACDELKDLAACLALLASILKKRHDYLKVKVAQLKEAVAAQDNKAISAIAQDIESQI